MVVTEEQLQILLKHGVHMLDGEAVIIGDVGFAGVKGSAPVLIIIL
ncbi:MAG: hypothetical protein ACXWV0_06175 [Flavisolibacter sp.]